MGVQSRRACQRHDVTAARTDARGPLAGRRPIRCPSTKRSPRSRLLASFALLLVSYGIERREAMPLAAVLVAPSMILWTFAGLETPLLAAIVTAMAVVYSQEESRRRPIAHCASRRMAGLAVLTRYDAVLFAGPVFARGACGGGLVSTARRLIAAVVAGSAAGPVVCVFMAARLAPFCRRRSTSRRRLRISTSFAVNIRYMTEHHGYRRHRRDGGVRCGLRGCR